MIAARLHGSGQVKVAVKGMTAADLLSIDVPASISAVDLKERVARSLDMCAYAFDLVSLDGSTKLEGSVQLSQLCNVDRTLDLRLIKRPVPRVNSSRFARLQSTIPEDADTTYQGRQTSGRATMGILGLRLAVFIIMLLIVWYKIGTVLSCVIYFYAVYLIEAFFFNPATRGLRHVSDCDSILAYIEKVKEWRPVPKVEAHCWHWETRWKRQTVRGETRIRSHQEKVHTQTFTQWLRVASWTDASGDALQGLHYFPFLQVHFEATWEADSESLREHERQRRDLGARAEAHDDHHDWWESLWLRDGNGIDCQLPHTDMIGATASRLPAWLGWKQYVVFTLVGLSWPYRWWLARNSITGDFIFRKVVRSQNTTTRSTSVRSRSRSRSR
mmetsp:Transcript_81516/g.148855  ORF Transcript_81516/g.148855 Transcript_81516/m.148855 type:complete len:386 (+) Transcript_81516:105-1262(+)